MDLLVFSGQSNMQGQTESLIEQNTVKNAYEYRLIADKLVPLSNPVGEDIGELLLGSHLGRGSLLPFFVQAYIKCCGVKAVAVHITKGATTLVEWLKDTREGKERYLKATEKITAAKKRVFDIGKLYFIWLQGESDALAGTSKDLYKEQLKRFKGHLKKDCAIDKFMIIRVGYFAANFGKEANDEQIMLAQQEVCKEDSDFVMLTDITGKLSADSAFLNPQATGHYNNLAMEIIGKAAGECAAKYRLGKDNFTAKKLRC